MEMSPPTIYYVTLLVCLHVLAHACIKHLLSSPLVHIKYFGKIAEYPAHYLHLIE